MKTITIILIFLLSGCVQVDVVDTTNVTVINYGDITVKAELGE